MQTLPSTDDLLRAMTILGIPGDPLYIMKDHDDERRRAELLAHISAALVDRLETLETLAGLGVDDRADLHWQADRDAAGPGRADRLQAARLAWVQQSVARQRGRRPDAHADAVATTLGVLIQLLAARDTPDAAGPMVADAVAGLCGAADHLGTVLRGAPRECV
ncbi:hypothetical protein [Dactylosporangium darangshiense]|uniref:TetR family transcriptional regulator n=1 Tax=Dactylosporangium darangshiense TaxID=579108 RepID=A0ABP8DN89_9ACTN